MRIADARLYHFFAFDEICDRMEDYMRETGTEVRPLHAEIFAGAGGSEVLRVVAATGFEAPYDRHAFEAQLRRATWDA